MAKSITGRWFEAVVKYTAPDKSGKTVTKKETAAFDAVNFGDAEAQAVHHFSELAAGDVDVLNINPAAYREVVEQDSEEESGWYKAKVAFIVLDEKTGKELRSAVTYLVEGTTLRSAIKAIDELLAPLMVDYYIVGIADAKITEVIHA